MGDPWAAIDPSDLHPVPYVLEGDFAEYAIGDEIGLSAIGDAIGGGGGYDQHARQFGDIHDQHASMESTGFPSMGFDQFGGGQFGGGQFGGGHGQHVDDPSTDAAAPAAAANLPSPAAGPSHPAAAATGLHRSAASSASRVRSAGSASRGRRTSGAGETPPAGSPSDDLLCSEDSIEDSIEGGISPSTEEDVQQDCETGADLDRRKVRRIIDSFKLDAVGVSNDADACKGPIILGRQAPYKGFMGVHGLVQVSVLPDTQQACQQCPHCPKLVETGVFELHIRNCEFIATVDTPVDTPVGKPVDNICSICGEEIARWAMKAHSRDCRPAQEETNHMKHPYVSTRPQCPPTRATRSSTTLLDIHDGSSMCEIRAFCDTHHIPVDTTGDGRRGYVKGAMLRNIRTWVEQLNN